MDFDIYKFIGGLVLLGIVIGLIFGVTIGRSELNLCPKSIDASRCPSFLRSNGGANAAPLQDEEQFYRGAFVQCLILGSYYARGMYSRQQIYQDCLKLTKVEYKNDVFADEVQGWNYQALVQE